MADRNHMLILEQGITVWNQWRTDHSRTRPDLSGASLNGADLKYANLVRADLSGADLMGATLFSIDLRMANLAGAHLVARNLEQANLKGASLEGADLGWATLHGANLSTTNCMRAYLIRADLQCANLNKADLRHADLSEANLNLAKPYLAKLAGAGLSKADPTEADLRNADLSGAHMERADLSWANLCKANLSGADLRQAVLLGTRLEEATVVDCWVWGTSTWEVCLNGALQAGLVITPPKTPTITVDNLEFAQFMYLLLNNEKLRDAIDTITTKVVLILGRFTPERKAVLDGIRNALRECNYLPILFDFDKPATRDTQETITTLARLARFVIADITDPKSIPQELTSVVEQLPSVPVQPLLQTDHEPWGMYDHIRRYPWVLELHRYDNSDDLLQSLQTKIIERADAKARQAKP